MKFGLLYEMETPRPWHALSEYNIYWEALAQIELADRIGIDYVWEVEHHFLEEYSHSSAPEVFYGAVSQRTKNIRIAHGVRLLPFNFNHPIKVAEQAAVLDIISNGRMELGTGRSTTVAGTRRLQRRLRPHPRGSARGARRHRQGVDRRHPRIRRQADQDSAAARGAQADPEAASADVDGVRRARQLSDGGRPRPGRAQLQPQLGAGAEVDGDYRKAFATRTDLVPKVPNEKFARR